MPGGSPLALPRLALCAAALLLWVAMARGDAAGAADIRRVLILLGHVGEEYREGVRDGQVVQPVEYEEASAFLDEAASRLRRAAPATADATAASFAEVRAALQGKVPADQVRTGLAQLSAAISRDTGISEPVFPAAAPSASRGRALFAENCVSCHGERADGRGPSAARLDPPPASFTDRDFMRGETPFDFLHVITLGKGRSAMPAWGDVLSLQDRWDLVSYLWTVHAAPAHWAEGQGVYLSACAGCHGRAGQGDGDYGDVLRVPARPLDDPATLARLSDAELYSLVAEGRSGTPMPGFAGRLSPAQIWATVGYVRLLSLGGDDGTRSVAASEGEAMRFAGLLRLLADEYARAVPAAAPMDPQELAESEILAEQLVRQAPRTQAALAAIDAAAAATLDAEVRQLATDIAARAPAPQVSAAALRAATLVQARFPAAAGSPPPAGDGLAEAARLLDDALAAYRRGEPRAVYLVSDAYFLFDPLEKTLTVAAEPLARRAEARFGELRAVMSHPGREAEAASIVAALGEDLAAARAALAPRVATGRANTVVQAALIILREGFEVVLILGALLAYAVRSGSRRLRAPILWGAASGAAASVITAYALARLLQASGAAAEVIEGATMLLAAVVLFTVSYWLISKAEAERWQRYIEGKVSSAIATGNLLALAGAAFLAVYREGVETVLFYQALIAAAPGQTAAILAGLAIGALALAIVYVLYQRLGRRLPLRQFFLGTGALLYYLAVVFAGKGVGELQEAGLVPTTAVPWIPRLDIVGIYPTVETLAAQGLLLLCAVYAVAVTLRRRRRAPDAGLSLQGASPGGASL